ncbi:holin [Terribacillus saccharophilus]|uniref:Holin n=1 Tax=Terribacillus saccharophilus TaxID=361277 RepID=A0A268A9H8_9BACI|nr:holin [Terribacillus saccharophilus]PAD20768.1 holin [Terribacillus saccharophilus]PAF17746.1 holin [Terribacillus saccharophilus]PAF21390.1 holin [Terribacillus saccharophilus]PAF39298.1 holin [Terribacillus saccharophilus]
MEEVMTFASIISPVVIALVQLVKKTVTVNKRYLPLISLLTGLLVGFLAWPFTELDVVLRLWAGGFAGLAASGLYSLGKRTISHNNNNDKAA